MRVQHYDLLFGLTASGSFLVDRLSKMYASTALAAGEIAVLPGLRFNLMFNSGISFSLLSSPTGIISWKLTALIALIVAVLIIAWRYYASTPLADIGFGLIIGGAVGNFVDRVCFGGVIDFIEFYYRAWSWPTFNLADVAIVMGFLFIIREAFNEAAA